MIINFRSGSSGWANYTVVGTPEKTRNQEINKIVGDPYFTEKIAHQNKFGGEYYKMLVAPGVADITNKEMFEILDEAIKNIFVGYKEDEYTYSAVLHRDSQYPHWHIITPKQNLLTGQHLQLYMQGIDTKRIKALQDTIAIKHGLKTMEEIKPIVRKQKKATYEKNSTKPIHFDFQDKKAKALAQQQVTELVKDNIEDINSTEDIKALVEANTDLKVVKINGHDYKNDFHYITVQDRNDTKTAVRGELFNPDFFKQPKQDQVQQLELNHKTYTEVEKEQIAKKIKADLRRENEKRYAVVQKQGTKIKAQKRAEIQELQNKIQKEKRDENPRRTTTPSQNRSQRSPSTKPTNNSYARARESRKREREARAREREKRTKSYAQYHNGATETDIGNLVREYRKCQLQREKERLSRGIIRELFNKISTVTRHFFEKIRKIEVEKDTTTPTVKEKATPIVEKAQNKENIKPTEAPESLNAEEESHSTVESPMSKEGLEKEFEKLVKSSKKLTDNNPKLS